MLFTRPQTANTDVFIYFVQGPREPGIDRREDRAVSRPRRPVGKLKTFWRFTI